MKTLSRLMSLAAYGWREAIRGKLFWVVVCAILLALLVTEFIGATAITEVAVAKVSILASLLRLLAVFMLMIYVVASLAREQADKTLDNLLALPLPRSTFYLGRLLGYAAVALAVSALCALALHWYAPQWQLGYWALSLFCELLLVAAAAALFTLTLRTVTATVAAVTAYYLFARSVSVLQGIGHGSLTDLSLWSNKIMVAVLDGLAYLVPDLRTFTQSEWLAYSDTPISLAPVLIQTIIYAGLLLLAGLIDLYRKEF